MPLPNGSRMIGRSRLEMTTRPTPTVPFVDLIPFNDVGALNLLGGLGIHLLVLDAVAGVAVELIERHTLGGRCRRIQRNRTRHERHLEIALPVGAGCHAKLLRY